MERINKKIGRPSIYTQELADEICVKIASNGKGIKLLCAENPHWPNKDTIFAWLKNYPDFSDQYVKAKQFQIETFIDDMLEIADDASQDLIANERGTLVSNNTSITRARLRIDTRKWLASKLVPKTYGLVKQDDVRELSVVEKLIRDLDDSLV